MHRYLYSIACCLLLTSLHGQETLEGVRIIKAGGGIISYHHDGKNTRLPVSPSLKLFDDKGEPVDVITGVGRYLQPGNIVDMKVTSKQTQTSPAKSKSKSKSKVTSPPVERQILEIRFVSGKVAEMPKESESNFNLRPDPNWKGNVYGGEGVKTDPYWIQYIPKAKVGDFVEYYRGKDKNEPARIETLEVGKDYVIIAKVFYILGSRQEQREKHRIGPASAGKKSKKTTATQILEIDGKKITCDVETSQGKPYRWKSTEIPFDGLVRNEVNGKQEYLVTSFGRGK